MAEVTRKPNVELRLDEETARKVGVRKGEVALWQSLQCVQRDKTIIDHAIFSSPFIYTITVSVCIGSMYT